MDTDYTVEIAMLDNSKEGLQEITDLLCKYCAYVGQKINARKTRSMAVSKVHGKGRILNETLRTSIWKVSLTWVLSSVRME